MDDGQEVEVRRTMTLESDSLTTLKEIKLLVKNTFLEIRARIPELSNELKATSNE
jgi:hypothetical protein